MVYMLSFINWLKNENLNEGNTRYSVEVNFRTKIDEILANYAKICLGYVSAALKAEEIHVKQIFEDGLIRLLVSNRNWDDGEWVVLVSWNPHHKSFFLSKGFYNKMHKSVNVEKESSKKLNHENAAEITREVKNMLHHLKDKPDRHLEKLKKIPLKTGPKS